jgi:DNA repair exonuclease SbcCD ATPase subunit
LAAAVAVGCSESTTRKDVASAQEKLDKAHANAQDTVQQAHNDVSDAQRTAQEHMVAKPVVTDEPAPPVETRRNINNQEKVADAQVDAKNKIADAKDKEVAAAANLKTTEQQFKDTQDRDAFLKEAESKLTDYDNRISTLKQQASNAQGADKDAFNRQVELVKAARDRASSAISELKKADLPTWKNYQDHVRMAFQELDNSVRNVR